MVLPEGKSCFTTVLGYSKEELESISFVGFIHSEDMITLAEVERTCKDRRRLVLKTDIAVKNGAFVLLSLNVTPDPETGNLYCIARDVTFERSQQEIVVQTSNELKAILNASEFSIMRTFTACKEFNRGAEVLRVMKQKNWSGKDQ
jgi:hypothetical protein